MSFSSFSFPFPLFFRKVPGTGTAVTSSPSSEGGKLTLFRGEKLKGGKKICKRKKKWTNN
jgi:hypothetical protein